MILSREDEQGVAAPVTMSEVPSVDDGSDIEDISEEIKKKPKKKSEEQDASVRQFRRKKHGWVKWVIIAVIVLGIIGLVVYKVVDAKKKLADAMNSNNTTTAEIKRMDISKAISATGTIKSKDVRTITSPLAGVKIDEVLCKVGDMVEQGAVVITFSREDINKKIGQLEEDITEAKQTKNLDGGDRKNSYVNEYDLQTYSVATSYESFQRAGTDLDKAKEDYQKAQNETSDFKNLHEEAKENVDRVQKELVEKQDELKKAQNPEEGDPDYDGIASLTNEVASLQAKVNKYRDALDNYDTKLESYQEAEKQKKNSLDTAQRSYDDAYVKFNKAGYDASFSDAKSDYNKNKGDLTANDNIKNLERQKEQNIDSLENYIITAPISGLVTEVNAQEGNGYQATTGALMTIQAVDIYEVTTQIDEYDINNVVLGQDVAIMTDATGEDELKGKVTFIAPTATAATGNSTSNTFEVRIDIQGKDERLKLGMSAKLNILVDTHKNVLAVPYDAIEEKDGGKTVIYVQDQSASKDQKKSDEAPSIQVFGSDGMLKSSEDDSKKPDRPVPGGAPAGMKEIPVQVGLESDYYTEVISNQIKEGMTVMVNSTAGELGGDFDMFMGPGPN